jgi:hypothetical protein
MTKILNLTLLLILVLHLWLGTTFELSHDEAYYWLYSKHLSWGFFDHPPVVGVLIKLFSFLPKSEGSVRAGFIILQSLTAVLLLKLVPQKRQLIAMILFFAFPLASLAGLFALPDMPLLFMTCLYCAILKRYLENEDTFSIIGLSSVIAILLYSKYHGILLVFFTLLAVPSLLKKKSFYVIATLSILLFLPHVIWQYDHNFSTLRYHFLERPKVDFSLKRLLEYSLAQVFLAGLFVGPVIWWSILKNKQKSDYQRVLKFICIGTFVFFLVSTFSKKFEANWTIFLTIPLIILSLQSEVWDKKWVKFLLVASIVPVFIARFLLPFTSQQVPIKRLSEFHGWRAWAEEINAKCTKPILANSYQIASKLSFYLDRPIHALNLGSRKNQFDYWEPNSAYYLSPEVCYVTDKKQFEGGLTVLPDGKNYKIVQDFIPSKMNDNSP